MAICTPFSTFNPFNSNAFGMYSGNGFGSDCFGNCGPFCSPGLFNSSNNCGLPFGGFPNTQNCFNGFCGPTGSTFGSPFAVPFGGWNQGFGWNSSPFNTSNGTWGWNNSCTPWSNPFGTPSNWCSPFGGTNSFGNPFSTGNFPTGNFPTGNFTTPNWNSTGCGPFGLNWGVPSFGGFSGIGSTGWNSFNPSTLLNTCGTPGFCPTPSFYGNGFGWPFAYSNPQNIPFPGGVNPNTCTSNGNIGLKRDVA